MASRARRQRRAGDKSGAHDQEKTPCCGHAATARARRDPHARAVRRPPQPRRQADVPGRDRRGDARGRRSGADHHRSDQRRHDRPGGRADEADRQFRQRGRSYRRDQRAPPRHHGHQHAGRPDRGHGGHDDGADPVDGAAAGRGLARHSRRAMDRLVADLDARAPDHRQASRHRRHGTHRPGAGAARARLRHVDPLSQSPPGRGANRGSARGDLLGFARPDAGADGFRLDQLPAYAWHLSTFCRPAG